jgi:NAD(P)H-hydrate epimerase
VICCGKGNNGGDGFVIARHLDNHGVAVRVLLFARPDELTGDAAVMYQIIVRAGLPITASLLGSSEPSAWQVELTDADWIVDALFGTGLRGPVRPPYDRVIAAINDSHAKVLAVDLPTGLDCDTGRPLGPTVRAQHTATFVAAKKGFAYSEAQPWVGQAHVIDIGIPRRLVPQGAHATSETSPGPRD